MNTWIMQLQCILNAFSFHASNKTLKRQIWKLQNSESTYIGIFMKIFMYYARCPTADASSPVDTSFSAPLLAIQEFVYVNCQKH